METTMDHYVSSPGGMITEAQEGATENGVKPQVINASQILQNALLPLQEKFPEHKLPTNETMWMDLYNKYFNSSHIVSYEEHLCTWLSLVLSAIQLKKDEESLLNCYGKAISLLPIKMFETDKKWTALINSLYTLIIDDALTETAASSVLKTAENKFKYSPKHARDYWNIVIRHQKIITKKSYKTQHDQHLRLTELFKIRFSTPYLSIEEDYREFSNWSSQVNLDQNIKLKLQKIYYENLLVDKMSFAKQIQKKLLKKDIYQSDHHLLFEQWVHELTVTPNFEEIQVICEEMIATEPNSLCYYLIYLNALASIKFEEDLRRDEKILKVIQRAHLLEYPSSSCEGIEQRFLEFSLVIASQMLPVEKVLELIEVVLKQFPMTHDVARWYASSRGVIIAINNLRNAKKVEDNAFENYFNKVIHPCTFDLFMNNTVPPSLAEKTGYEIPCINLLTLWIKTQETYYNLEWEQTLKLWTRTFSYNSNPIFLVGYVDFVKINVYVSRFPNSNICEVTSPGFKIKGFSPYQTDGPCMTSSRNHTSSKDSLNSSYLETMKLYNVFVSSLYYDATEEDLTNAFKDKGFYPVAVEIKRFPDGRSRGVATVSFETKEAADLAIRLCNKFNVCGRQTIVKEFNENHKFQVRKPTPSEPQPTTLNLTNLSEEWKDEDKVKNRLASFGHVKSVLRKDHSDSVSFSIRVEFHMKEDAENAFEQVKDNKIFGDNVLCRLGYASLKQKLKEEKAKYEVEVKKKKPKKPKVSEEKVMEVDQEQVEPGQEVSHLLDLENSSPQGTDTSTAENNQIGPQVPMGFIKNDLRPAKNNNLKFMPMQALRRDLPRAPKRNHMKNRLDFAGPSNSSGSLQESQDPISRDESAFDSTFSSQSSTDTTESPSPKKKFPRMGMDRDVKERLHLNSASSPKDNDMVVQELEIYTNAQAGTSGKQLNNEDFKKLFLKN